MEQIKVDEDHNLTLTCKQEKSSCRSWVHHEHVINMSLENLNHLMLEMEKKGNQLSSSWTCNEHVIKKSKSLNVWNGKKEVISWVHEHVMNMPLENLNHLMLKMEKKKVISSSWTCNEHAIKKSKSLDTRNGEKKGNQPV